jgi:predicted GNAT superfamily acetyltransferase
VFDIRALTIPEDLYTAAEFQKIHAPDIQFEMAALIALAHNGGLVLGAYDQGQMVGLTASFLGSASHDPRRPAMANLKLTAATISTDPVYQESDLAFDLMIKQREFATRLGIRLITWTLDPLDTAFAVVSLGRLGAISNQYVPNYYTTNGMSESDRLVVEWWVTNRRVEERLNGNRGRLSLENYLDGNAEILSHQTGMATSGFMALMEIPTDIKSMETGMIPAWRDAVRDLASAAFHEGYIVTDFVQGQREGQLRSYYVMSRVPPQAFSAN